MPYNQYEHVHKEGSYMPKLIENAKELILETAEKLLFQVGYKGFKIREIASRCGIASGTIFNYFASKEMLITAIMARDWDNLLAEIKRECDLATDMAAAVSVIYKGIKSFVQKYESILMDYPGNIIGQFRKHHVAVRQQITDILSILLVRLNRSEPLPVVSIFAEAVLASSVQEDIDLQALLQFTLKIFPPAVE